jgi:hypothetical protein
MGHSDLWNPWPISRPSKILIILLTMAVSSVSSVAAELAPGLNKRLEAIYMYIYTERA